MDGQYLKDDQTTGIYQCYCLSLIKKTNFWKIWTNDTEFEVCQDYVKMGLGGTILTVPFGVFNAILSNFGVILVFYLVNKIRFKSRHKKMLVTMISIFIIAYINMGLS